MKIHKGIIAAASIGLFIFSQNLELFADGGIIGKMKISPEQIQNLSEEIKQTHQSWEPSPGQVILKSNDKSGTAWLSVICWKQREDEEPSCDFVIELELHPAMSIYLDHPFPWREGSTPITQAFAEKKFNRNPTHPNQIHFSGLFDINPPATRSSNELAESFTGVTHLVPSTDTRTSYVCQNEEGNTGLTDCELRIFWEPQKSVRYLR